MVALVAGAPLAAAALGYVAVAELGTGSATAAVSTAGSVRIAPAAAAQGGDTPAGIPPAQSSPSVSSPSVSEATTSPLPGDDYDADPADNSQRWWVLLIPVLVVLGGAVGTLLVMRSRKRDSEVTSRTPPDRSR